MLEKVLKQFLQNKYIFLVLGLIVLSIFARFLWLNYFPSGIDHDQAEVILSSKSLFLFGVDSSGTKFPQLLFSNFTKAGIAGLPSTLLAPILGIINLNLINTRIVFVCVNILTVIFLSFFVYEITKNKYYLISTLSIGLINPWFFTYSRQPTEAPFSLLLIMIGIYLFFKYWDKNFYYSLPFFVGAFYSYFGAKPIIPLLITGILIIHFVNNKKRVISLYITYLLLSMLLVLPYFSISRTVTTGDTYVRRSVQEIIFLNPNLFTEKVNEFRRASIDFPNKEILYNKYVFMIQEFFKKYTSWLSSDFLIWGGDARGMYRFDDHGLIYGIDVIFLILGIYLLGISLKNKENNVLKYLILLLFIISPIPPALSLNGESFYYRGFILPVGFILLISYGVSELIQKSKRKYKNLLMLGIYTVYLLSFINFLIFYFFRYPVKQQENNFTDKRILSNYLLRSIIPVVVVTTSPHTMLNQYLFYSGEIKYAKNMLSAEKYSYLYKNFELTKECPKSFFNKTIVLDSRINCSVDNNEFITIQNQNDSGVVFKIFNDKLCNNVRLENYRRNHKISDYNIEKMTNTEFCNRWIQNGESN